MSTQKHNSLDELADFLTKNDNYLISGHVQPDGDVFGSTFAMYLILKNFEKKVTVSFEPAFVPKKYRFLQETKIKNKKDIDSVDNFIVMECPDRKRLGALEELSLKAAKVINIDHHLENDFYGDINVVDPGASATTEMIYKLARILDVDITKKIANCIYVGLVTDTGRFQYSNTKAETFELAAELVKNGVEPGYIFEAIYENCSMQSLVLLGTVVNNLKLAADGKIIWSFIDRRSTPPGTDPGDTENLINYIRSVEGPLVAALIKMDDEEHKVSLRSKGDIDVAEIASKMNGGGHKNAAGFSSTMKMEEIIQWLEKQVKQKKSSS